MDGPCDSHSLPFPAGELVRELVLHAVQADQPQVFHRPGPERSWVFDLERRADLDVLGTNMNLGRFALPK